MVIIESDNDFMEHYQCPLGLHNDNIMKQSIDLYIPRVHPIQMLHNRGRIVCVCVNNAVCKWREDVEAENNNY